MEEEFSERTQFDLMAKRTRLIDDKSLFEVYPPSAAMAGLSDILKMYSGLRDLLFCNLTLRVLYALYVLYCIVYWTTFIYYF